MNLNMKKIVLLLAFLGSYTISTATEYYVHPIKGKDENSGLSKGDAFKTLERASEVKFLPGDQLFLASGQIHYGSLTLRGLKGNSRNPILITNSAWEIDLNPITAKIDFSGFSSGIRIENSNHIRIENLIITKNRYNSEPKEKGMTCGVLVITTDEHNMNNIQLNQLTIVDVFHENPGFKRNLSEVKSANGTQSYGWGIRVINKNDKGTIENIAINNCFVKNVSHTGIKFSGNRKNIVNVSLLKNRIERTGGPGIQMSGVKFVLVAENTVSYSGSNDDSRKWGRGSGIWTWSSSNVLIEKNRFTYANGPADSAGAHIDYNCDNIVLQYNFSAYNAGGFCEILGNNYNCAYRFNISVNDGYRVKGENNAFQEGKIFWLSGYQGNKKRKGPINSYFYNNTIYTNGSYTPKIAIDNTSSGILIANNIFALKGKTEQVMGDQYKPEKKSNALASRVVFKNNLFLTAQSWPQSMASQDIYPLYGNPQFKNEGGLQMEDYIPQNTKIIDDKGAVLDYLPGDNFGLIQGLNLQFDVLGNAIGNTFPIGAIVPEK